MNVYAILANSELLSNYFNTYKEALDTVKEKYQDWNENPENKVDVEERHKMYKALEDSNITELYIEKGINISIHKLVVKPKSASGGYSRRRHSKSNTKSRKHMI